MVITANGKPKVPDGVVLANGETATPAGVKVEAIAAYDIKPGEPSHPKGEANGYVITLGGKRLYFAGVTECVPEVRALKNIDVAFMPMNIPLAADDAVGRGRVREGDRAEDRLPLPLRSGRARRGSTNPSATAEGPAGGLTVAQSLQAFKDALRGQAIEVRDARWYP